MNRTYELKNFIVKVNSPIFPSETGNGNCISINDSPIINEIEDIELPEVPFSVVTKDQKKAERLQLGYRRSDD